MRSRPQLYISAAQIPWIIFAAFLVVRLAFAYLSGYDSFQLLSDTGRYDAQSDQILAGNLNLRESLFITAPIYPYFEALFKWIFNSYWIPALQLAQIIVSALSGVYLYKLSNLIWKDTKIGLITAAVYCLFPFTFWWVHTFSQEMLFQSLLIFTVYVFLKAINENEFRYLVVSAILFSLTFLTKSHILLFAPFIPIIILFSQNRNLKEKLVSIAVFAGICLAFTLPYGLYNLRVNGTYVISSTGQGTHFLLGHNDDAYLTIVDPPPHNSAEWERLSGGNFHVFAQLLPQVQRLTEAQKQKLFFDEGVKWCLANPQKALKVAFYDLYRFLIPGLNSNWYPFKQWLLSIMISFPIYLFGYVGIYLALRQNFRYHFWILALVLSMIFFSVGFYVQNRFRTITLEPFYIVYAAFCVNWLWNYAYRRYLKAGDR